MIFAEREWLVRSWRRGSYHGLPRSCGTLRKVCFFGRNAQNKLGNRTHGLQPPAQAGEGARPTPSPIL